MFGFFSPDDDEPDIPPETNELLTFLADAADEALDTFPPDELSMVRILLDTLDETEVPKSLLNQARRRLDQYLGNISSKEDGPTGKRQTRSSKSGTDLELTLKVYPQGMSREVTRTMTVCASDTLDDLCYAILDAFEFYDISHLYEFNMDCRPYSFDSYQCDADIDRFSRRVKISSLNLMKGQKFALHYDFGDDWLFIIRVQSIQKAPYHPAHVTKSKGHVEQYPDWDDDEDPDDWED